MIDDQAFFAIGMNAMGLAAAVILFPFSLVGDRQWLENGSKKTSKERS